MLNQLITLTDADLMLELLRRHLSDIDAEKEEDTKEIISLMLKVFNIKQDILQESHVRPPQLGYDSILSSLV